MTQAGTLSVHYTCVVLQSYYPRRVKDFLKQSIKYEKKYWNSAARNSNGIFKRFEEKIRMNQDFSKNPWRGKFLQKSLEEFLQKKLWNLTKKCKETFEKFLGDISE